MDMDGPRGLFVVSGVGPSGQAFRARGASQRCVDRSVAGVPAAGPTSRRFERPKTVEAGSGLGGSDGNFMGILLLPICGDTWGGKKRSIARSRTKSGT